MKLTCSQFEGLITFYIDNELSESLKKSFEEHLHECAGCSMKFKVIKSIVEDIKNAYDKVLRENKYEDNIEKETVNDTYIETDELNHLDLSAYIDNELSDENNIRVRRNIIVKPSIRKKIEKMYKLRKILSGSFNEQKNILRSDYSKDVMRTINSNFSTKEVCIHCFLFILIVISAVALSVWVVIQAI